MQGFSFENQGTYTYLVYTIARQDNIDTLSLGMITNNRISGLAPTIFTQMNDNMYIKYNVSSKVSLKQFFSASVNKKRLIGVFSGIVDALLTAEDYMIDTGSILLDLDYIFVDVTSCETILICLPIINEGISQIDLGAFFKAIMFSTQFDQTENCDYIAKIINFLNSNAAFSLADFKALLDTIKNGESGYSVQQRKAVQPAYTPQSQPVKQQCYTPPQQAQQAVSQPIQQQLSVQKTYTAPQTIPANKAGAQNNFQVPPQQQKQQPQQVQQPQQASANGQKISMFNLLMHYSKENAALYKAQKAESKMNKKATAQQKATKAQNNQYNGSGTQKAKNVSNIGFAIPGHQTQPYQPQPYQTNPQPTKKAAVTPIPNTANQPNANQPSAQVGAMPSNTQPQQTPVNAQTPSVQSKSMNFGNTTVLGDSSYGKTTVLSTGMMPNQTATPYLIRIKNNEKIPVNKPVYRIGKERSYVDYFIGDNTAISRSHANIVTNNSEYFVVDTNSTNHTYVNGSMIQSNVETKIAHGDKLRFANEEFEFRLY